MNESTFAPHKKINLDDGMWYEHDENGVIGNVYDGFSVVRYSNERCDNQLHTVIYTW